MENPQIDILNNLLPDFEDLFKVVYVPKYVFHDDIYYINRGIDLAELRRLLLKTELEDFTEYLIFAGYEFKAHKEGILNSSLITLRKEVKDARTLNLLRSTPYSKIELFMNSNIKNSLFLINEVEVMQIIHDFYEKKFGKETINGFEKISQKDLNDFIIHESNIAFRSGAPSIMHRPAMFAEILIFLMNYKDNPNATPKTITSFSNEQCRIVHDFLYFWGFIEDKTQQGIRHSYIRTMISNLRKQREKGYIK